MTNKIGKSISSARNGPKTHFERDVILEIVRRKETGVSNRLLCQEYGMSSSALMAWIHRYGSAAYIAGIKIMHTPQQIRPIVRAIQEGRLSLLDAAAKCKVSIQTIRNWVKNFQPEETVLPIEQPTTLPAPVHPSADSVLLKELESAQLKIKALETMIEVAEEQFKIPIRKKFGAKQ